MESLEITAKTVEEAIQQALEQLNVNRDEVEVTVLSEGKSGILGLGAEEARIRVNPLVPVPGERDDIARAARAILEKLLSVLQLRASVAQQGWPFVEEGEKVPIVLNIRGDDLGILIGRRGQTLDCLQYITRLILAHQTKSWEPVIIDVEGYRQRRVRSLHALARRIAGQVETNRI